MINSIKFLIFKIIKKILTEISIRFRFKNKFTQKGLNELDIKLEKYLNYDKGFFLEIGGNDGINQSNTFYLEKVRKWQGILIEGIPELFEKCKKNRECSKVYNCAVVGNDYLQKKIRMEFANLMSVAKGTTLDAKDHIKKGMECQNIKTYSIEVEARTLQSILKENNIKYIDFFSLDVEGFEYEVLKGLDLKEVNIKYILIEIQENDLKTKIEEYFAGNYELIEKLTHHDYLYRKI